MKPNVHIKCQHQHQHQNTYQYHMSLTRIRISLLLFGGPLLRVYVPPIMQEGVCVHQAILRSGAERDIVPKHKSNTKDNFAIDRLWLNRVSESTI